MTEVKNILIHVPKDIVYINKDNYYCFKTNNKIAQKILFMNLKGSKLYYDEAIKMNLFVYFSKFHEYLDVSIWGTQEEIRMLDEICIRKIKI